MFAEDWTSLETNLADSQQLLQSMARSHFRRSSRRYRASLFAEFIAKTYPELFVADTTTSAPAVLVEDEGHVKMSDHLLGAGGTAAHDDAGGRGHGQNNLRPKLVQAPAPRPPSTGRPPRVVVDVAGGCGALATVLATKLLKHIVSEVVVLDPKVRSPKKWQRNMMSCVRFLHQELHPPAVPSCGVEATPQQSHEEGQSRTPAATAVEELLRRASLIVALHPCQATEAIFQWGDLLKVPVCVIP